MGRLSAENKFLFLSAMVVLLVGIKTAASILEEPVSGVVLAKREPSSIQSFAIGVKSTDLNKETLSGTPNNFDFDCRKESDLQKIRRIKVSGSFLQVRGKGCPYHKSGFSVRIINKSNGYTASIFGLNKDEFRTDLIQLVEGANQISIEYQSPNGKKTEQKLLINSSHI